jgi:single-strand DNA-binding protein
MASFNQITLIGNVGNLEVKTFTNGGKIVEASLATTKRWKDRNGDPHEETQWHRLIIGGALAETAERYVSKGDPLLVQGEMTYRQWETREGEKRTAPEVRVQTLQLLTRKEQAAAPAARPAYEGTDHGDDLPF